jgi:hypothetical protein
MGSDRGSNRHDEVCGRKGRGTAENRDEAEVEMMTQEGKEFARETTQSQPRLRFTALTSVSLAATWMHHLTTAECKICYHLWYFHHRKRKARSESHLKPLEHKLLIRLSISQSTPLGETAPSPPLR